MVASRTFCCCLPVRLGVFFLSLGTFAGAGTLAGATWWELSQTWHMPTVQKVAFILAGASWSLLSLFSLFGFIGSIIRKRSFVSLFSKILWIHWLFSIAVGAFFIYSLYSTNSQEFINACIEHAEGSLDKERCKDVLKVLKGVYIGVLVFVALCQFYCCIIVSRYVTQLDEEQSFRAISRAGDGAFATAAPSYYPHDPVGQHTELLPPKGGYPYADPHNSFGNAGAAEQGYAGGPHKPYNS